MIIFREPSSKFRFNNGTIKELTGGGMFRHVDIMNHKQKGFTKIRPLSRYNFITLFHYFNISLFHYFIISFNAFIFFIFLFLLI